MIAELNLNGTIFWHVGVHQTSNLALFYCMYAVLAQIGSLKWPLLFVILFDLISVLFVLFISTH